MRYEEWTRLRLNLFSCYLGVPTAKVLSINVHHHSAWLVLEGTAELESGGKIIKASPGHWLIGGPGPREQRLSDDIRLLSVLFYANWPSGDPLFPHGLPLKFAASERPQLERVGQRINTVIERHSPGHNYLTLMSEELPIEIYLRFQEHLPSFLRELIAALRGHGITTSDERELDPRIVHALEIMQELPLDGSFKTPDVAVRSGISTAHLERLFLVQVGRTPKQHFDRRRLLYAEEALAKPGARVKEVAALLGFNSLANFTRWFQRFHKLPPRIFQKSPK